MLTFTPVFAVISLAAESAPARPERNTGFTELLAIMAIVNFLPAAEPEAPAPFGVALSPEQADSVASAAASAVSRIWVLCVTVSH
jgi:hypothetical protein